MIFELFTVITLLSTAYSAHTAAITTLNTPTELISAVPTDTPLSISIPTTAPVVVPTETPSSINTIQILSATSQPTTPPDPIALPSSSDEPTLPPTPTPIATPTTHPSPSTTSESLPTQSPLPTLSPSPTPVPTTTSTPSPEPTDTPSPTSTPQTYTITGPELDALFTKYSDQYKIDREELKKIAVCESHLNTNALNKSYGYAGLYQFSASSWQGYRKLMGQDPEPSLRFSPEEAVETAAWMISTGRIGAWPSCK
jgi:hypothetical protein